MVKHSSKSIDFEDFFYIFKEKTKYGYNYKNYGVFIGFCMLKCYIKFY